jgi:glutamate-1-semialdehyde 2,1-aminomutase
MASDPRAIFPRSAQLTEISRRYVAGGSSSAVRSTAKPLPLFFQSASGSHLVDVDGRTYIDYALAWGPLILGHCHPAIVQAVEDQLRKFMIVGAQHELEIKVGQKICAMVPCAERVAYSSTGSEVVQMAVRLARAYTRRRRFIRFEGHYHGWHDNVLVSYHPQRVNGKVENPPYTEGSNERAAEEVIALPWNDLSRLEATLEARHDEIAAIITEPILCNCSCLMPAPGYLAGMRELATRYGVVLIFDEVITGFRVAPGGAQGLYGITPDLVTLGKAVAGGLPLSVVAGKNEIMDLIAERRVMHGGTFNGHPLALAAALATLETLDAHQGAAFAGIRKTGEALMAGIKELAREAGIPVLINGVGAVFHVSFTHRAEMRDYWDTLDADVRARDVFLGALVESGIYPLPDGRWYVSTAHDSADVEASLAAVGEVFRKHKQQLIATVNIQNVR